VATDKCVYTKERQDGYGTDWSTACGRDVRCEAPVDVGWSFAPLPNEGGKFCHFCGKEIELKGK